VKSALQGADVGGAISPSHRSVEEAPNPFNVGNIAKLVDSPLATALHSEHSMIHPTLGMTPGGIVFNRDMFLNIPLLTDSAILQHK
jgi:hypothetical protein